jgi:hypothetical protein
MQQTTRISILLVFFHFHRCHLFIGYHRALLEALFCSLPIASNCDHALRENMGAVNVQLTPADLQEIETAFSRIEIYGGRMDARQMAQIGQDGD